MCVQGGSTTRFWSAAAGFLIKVACFYIFFQSPHRFILKLQKMNNNTNIQHTQESFDSPEKVSETSHIHLPLENPTACGIQRINRVCLANCLFLLLQAKSESGNPLL